MYLDGLKYLEGCSLSYAKSHDNLGGENRISMLTSRRGKGRFRDI